MKDEEPMKAKLTVSKKPHTELQAAFSALDREEFGCCGLLAEGNQNMNVKYTGQKTQTFKSLPIGAKFAWMIKLNGTPYMATGWTKVGKEDHIADCWDAPVKAEGYELEHQVVNLS